ncbi:mutator 2 [Musca autumnalis]|uniref:mutator 2 n=1 Tax=Musca autumnalis TaxID=221902 RepID=UPI003CED19F3
MNENTMFVDINGRQRPLEVGQLYLFGKLLPPNDANKFVFNIDNEDVDEKHCCVGVFSEDVFIYDLFSSKGTYLNGKRLMPFTKTCVKSGDVIKLGQFQSIRFYNEEQLEVSHDSSGFGDNNKNTSDIIASSPESTNHRDSRVKRLNSNSTDNFLVPAIPASLNKSTTKQTSRASSSSFVIPETEAALSSSRRSSLGFNTTNNKSRNSDSFTIPETQYCGGGGGRASLASNLSIAESTEGDKSRMDNSTNDDDFCIPETQEIISSQRPRPFENKMKTLEEKSVDLNDSDDEGINGSDDAAGDGSGSQFRICTQDYNDGFGEEDDSLMQSQVIPIIKHNTVLLNASTAIAGRQELNASKETSTTTATEEDNEVANINAVAGQKPTIPANNDDLNCTTPDLFDCQALEDIVKENNAAITDLMNADVNIFQNQAQPDTGTGMDDEEDYLATQMFPASNHSTRKNSGDLEKDKKSKEKNIFDGKEDEHYLTLSDKENMRPDKLEPITDLPPTQLFASNDASSEHSSTSTSSSRKSNTRNKNEVKPASETSQKQREEDLLAAPTTSNMGDEEDDILTQAFIPPPRTKILSSTTSSKQSANNCFNSTLLEDKTNEKNPASFFAEMETSPKGLEKSNTSNSNNFKIPERNFTAVKKTSSAASTASTESDMDLLMCTPQFIKDHIPFTKPIDLKKSILAIKNKNLFGDDDEDNDDNKDSDKDECLVQLINVPKNTNDFDKLLPHLKQEAESESKTNPQMTKEQKAAIEARKQYKFNTSFGDQEKAKTDRKSSSSTLSRDERHAARDREREDKKKSHNDKVKVSSRQKKKDAAESSKEESKDNNNSSKETDNLSNDKVTKSSNEKDKETSSSGTTEQKRSSRRTKDDKDQNQKTSNKRNTRSSQDHDSDKKEEILVVKQARQAKEKETTDSEQTRPARRNTRQQSSDKPPKESKPPARRNTRLKSKLEEAAPSSKESVTSTDDLDSIPTQPYIPITRTRTRSRSQQKDANDARDRSSDSSATTVPYNLNTSRTLNRSNSRLNSSTTSSAEKKPTNTTSVNGAGRKRKPDISAPHQIEEKKRLKRVNSSESTTSTTPSSSTSTTLSSRPLISITMVDADRFVELQSKSKGLWAVAKDPKDSEILVMDKTFRTFKFLLAMARGIPIVTSQWLNDINSAKSLKKVPHLSKYILNDPVFEKKHKFVLQTSLQLARENKQGIFHGYEFVMTANIKPTPPELQAIIEIAGGIVHTNGTPAPKENQNIYLISCNDDRKDWHKFRRINKNITIITTEAIMSSVMRQNCTPLANHVLV